ncbi:MAG: glyoxalase [Pedosphaera sp.]|nr:glyoxalase [Pedosphaera sp.]
MRASVLCGTRTAKHGVRCFRLCAWSTGGIVGRVEHRDLNHVALHVEDVEKSCEFYERVLHLRSMPRPAFTFPGAWYRLGTTQELHLIGGRRNPIQSGNRGNHYALLVDDMDAWEAHLRALNVEYLPRRTRPDGAWQIYVKDPDGHTIEICTAPTVVA